MSTRRTKKNRVKAKLRHYQLSKDNSSLIKNKAGMKIRTEDLFHYDTGLIIKDLTRTLISTIIVFGVLVALYYQL
jgi:hypothetical protein